MDVIWRLFVSAILGGFILDMPGPSSHNEAQPGSPSSSVFWCAHVVATATSRTEQEAESSHEETEGEDERPKGTSVHMSYDNRPEQQLENLQQNATEASFDQDDRLAADSAYDQVHPSNTGEPEKGIVTSELGVNTNTDDAVGMRKLARDGDGRSESARESYVPRKNHGADDKLVRGTGEQEGKRREGAASEKANTGNHGKEESPETTGKKISELPIRSGAPVEDVVKTPSQRYDFQQYQIDLSLYREMKKRARRYAQGADVLEAKAMAPEKLSRFRLMWERAKMYFEEHFPADDNEI